MSIPTDLQYCLIYPMSYVRDTEPDHFDTRNNPVGTHLHRCICHATLQYMNTDPKQLKKYSGSHLILPHGAQYNDQLFPMILEPWNHWEPLEDPLTKEPFPMELVGDFWAADPIFKGCYGDSLLYSDVELHWLRWQGIHLLTYQEDIPVLLAPLYRQAHQGWRLPTHPWSLPRPNAPEARVAPTAAQDAAPTPQLQNAQTPLQPRSPPVPKSQP